MHNPIIIKNNDFHNRFLRRSCFLNIGEDVQTHGTMGDELTVADDVLQIAHQTELEEHYGVDTFLAARAVITFGQGVEKIQIQNFP